MPAQRKYPDELRERAVRMVLEIRARDGKGHGELARVGRQLGVHPEALRGWVKIPRSGIPSGWRISARSARSAAKEIPTITRQRKQSTHFTRRNSSITKGPGKTPGR